MNEELKPCPFCGDEMKLETIADVVTGPGEVFVQCDGCGAMGGGGGNLDEAIAAWNRRTPVSGEAQAEVVAYQVQSSEDGKWYGVSKEQWDSASPAYRRALPAKTGTLDHAKLIADCA